MNIQRILLSSFLLLLFLATIPIIVISFYASKISLEEEIGRSLKNDAAMLMEQIDMLVFERLQNVHSWSHLDIIQEGRIGDVDKRLAQFLAELEHGYPGVYSNLFYVNNDKNLIIAAGNSALIQQPMPVQTDWLQAQVPHGEVFLETLQLQPPYQRANLVIRAPVQESYTGREMGQLYGVFDLQQIFRLFDKASHSDAGDRFVILLDADGRAIAASESVRNKKLLLNNTFASWKRLEQNGIAVYAGQPLTESAVLVGYAASKGYQGYANMGWALLVIQSTEQAFHPILALWWLFAGVFIVSIFIASGFAQWGTKRIAKPLVNLTRWAQHFQKHTDYAMPKASGVQEIQALSQAFGQLTEDLEKSRQQVIHAAKLAVVGEMAAIMAHEVRTPLGILQTTAQMLDREASLSSEGHEMTQMLVEESARLNRLITTLLDCSNPRLPSMRPQDLTKIILRVVDLLSTQAQKKAIKINLSKPGQVITIECDAELLVQVFLNLILNAIQLLPPGGFIQIATEKLTDTTIKITIADNGSGIAPENCTRLFDPFFTTREGGIGLGLTVTQQIINAHAGSIVAANSEQGGACFTIILPISKEQ